MGASLPDGCSLRGALRAGIGRSSTSNTSSIRTSTTTTTTTSISSSSSSSAIRTLGTRIRAL
jgi:hypothetical protein